MAETTVIIVGAGPSGLATAACLSQLSIPYILLEREDCHASLWKKKAYDRVHLHLPKQYCQLPYIPLPQSCPKYISKDQFIDYLDNYAGHFNIKSLCQRRVESAEFDEDADKWHVVARNLANGEEEEYVGRFLVVATGWSTDPFRPNIEGMSSFPGTVVHTDENTNPLDVH